MTSFERALFERLRLFIGWQKQRALDDGEELADGLSDGLSDAEAVAAVPTTGHSCDSVVNVSATSDVCGVLPCL